jgi:DNA repair photolyase
MTKAKGNMYDWVDWTCDPTHFCSHDCSYCYAKPWMKSTPELNEKELNTIIPGSGKIFIGHLGDLFCEGMPDNIISTVMVRCLECANNQYVFQTKNPARYLTRDNLFPTNSILGTTVETNNDNLMSMFSGAPFIPCRIAAMLTLKERQPEIKTFITIEPIMKFSPAFADLIISARPDFVNIGADSKHHNLPEPTYAEVLDLIERIKQAGIEIRVKSNLGRLARQ